ncbi:MAG: L-2-amino-thiazoline-4-carboxylic acid hydrolase [Anaerolineae bacterium]|nr:L-2-amino-thiazoline-4-carboxylic acid hydrolase [Anaerolineae bacterium]
MDDGTTGVYYLTRQPELLNEFDKEAQHWKMFIVAQFDEEFANAVLTKARKEFEALIPQIPYIGGDKNHLTEALIESIRYLAFFRAMKLDGKTAAETGKILYDATVAQINEPHPPIPPDQRLTPEQLIERRKQRAAWSQEKRYPEDYLYEYVPGDGQEFDYGYDFFACAAQKFYHTQGADEFMPFYCFLDYPKSQRDGLGLSRTITLAEGHPKCNHRFKQGRKVDLRWPPPFLTEMTGASK